MNCINFFLLGRNVEHFYTLPYPSHIRNVYRRIHSFSRRTYSMNIRINSAADIRQTVDCRSFKFFTFKRRYNVQISISVFLYNDYP